MILKDVQTEKEAFFKSLEVGEDGTFFINEGTFEYSLKEILEHAFSLFYYHLVYSFNDVIDLSSDQSISRLKKSFVKEAQLYFSKFLCYTNNARRILSKMDCYEDDKTVENDFDVVVYRNPKDNKVIEFSNFMKVLADGENYTTSLTTELLREEYGIDDFYVISLNPGFAFGIENLNLVDIESLTTREKEAFYGNSAQQSFGWVPVDLISKSRAKLYNKVK